YQKNVSAIVDAMRSLIGESGVAYLEYNELMLRKNAMDRAKRQPLLGVTSRYDIAASHASQEELDNPGEMTILQMLLTFLRTSLDATELARLELVQDELQYELWHVWKCLR